MEVFSSPNLHRRRGWALLLKAGATGIDSQSRRVLILSNRVLYDSEVWNRGESKLKT